MSNFLAVAAVTETLRKTLEGPVGAAITGALTTALRPDDVPAKQVGVNVFLYQTMPNPAWRNERLPSRDDGGAMIRRPRAALDLHYLLTFHGSDATFEPQRLLGTVVRVLEAGPILTRTAVRNAVGAVTPLKPSDLADDVDVVRVTPLPLSLEELSKLWSVFFQAKYKLSAAYVASTVLIEGTETSQTAVPVAMRGVLSNASIAPLITRVASRAAAAGSAEVTGMPVLLTDTLIIEGEGLKGTPTRLRIGNSVFTPANVAFNRIEVNLNAELPAAEKRAGVKIVQVIHEITFGSPGDPHRGFESNAVPFMLSPAIGVTGATHTSVTVSVNPPLALGQRVVMLLNEKASPARAFAFEKVIDAGSVGGSLTMTFAGVATAKYLVRLQVDGAESPLDTDTNPLSPTFGLYLGTPEANIP